MNSQIIIFLFSLLLFSVFIYIIGNVWFNGKRNKYIKIFFAMGILFSFWTLLNGVSVLLNDEIYVYYYPITMICVIMLPFILLMYMLHFTQSKFAESRVLTHILIILPVMDILFLLTNPLHHMFISSYINLRPQTGSLFWIHALISYLTLIIAIVIFVRFLIKNIKATPSLLIIGLSLILPLVLNVLYTYEIVDFNFDVTPIGFLMMFSTFAMHSVKLRLFNVRNTAVTSIFTSLTDAFLVIDSLGYVVDANPAFINTFSGLKLVMDKTSSNEVEMFFSSILLSCKPEDAFSKFTSHTGDISDAEISVSINNTLRNYSLSKNIISERGQYAGYIITLKDVSNYYIMINEINEQNKKLLELKNIAESASNSKSAFLANMSHEIRTPMNAIIGMTSIAQTSSSPQKVDECLGKISTASKHLLGIINDILDMSKIEANKFELSPESFVFLNMINDIFNIFENRTIEKNQKLIVELDEDLPKLFIGDKLRLSQIINNLLSNAVKFTPSGGNIKLAVRLLSTDENIAKMQVSVEDDGIGISAEQQKKLFKAFEQADASISRKFGGTGLGLSLSKNIVSLLGGNIWVESETGKGSKFIFDFSMQLGEGQPLEELTAESVYDFSGCTILLAEDIEINREIVMAILGETGVSFECAENGQAAYELFQKNPEKYSVIFMDIHMPILDGYSATKKIRDLEHPYAKTVPIIAMTANAFKEDIDKSKKAGMNDHIAKPIDAKILFQKTNNLIANQVL